MKLFLGTHHASWLETAGVPLCISWKRMPVKKLHRAVSPWVLDSGAYNHLGMHGGWGGVKPAGYAALVRRLQEGVGRLEWASILDWPCSPASLDATKLDVWEHQRRTAASFLELRELAPEVPWLPVVQGWDPLDYMDHVEMYHGLGVDLREASVVGVGSIASRQDKPEAAVIVRALARFGLRLHGFGVKQKGLALFGSELVSADSMTWSLEARREERLPGCEHPGNCANCLPYALSWRARILAQEPRHSNEFLRAMECS